MMLPPEEDDSDLKESDGDDLDNDEGMMDAVEQRRESDGPEGVPEEGTQMLAKLFSKTEANLLETFDRIKAVVVEMTEIGEDVASLTKMQTEFVQKHCEDAVHAIEVGLWDLPMSCC